MKLNNLPLCFLTSLFFLYSATLRAEAGPFETSKFKIESTAEGNDIRLNFLSKFSGSIINSILIGEKTGTVCSSESPYSYNVAPELLTYSRKGTVQIQGGYFPSWKGPLNFYGVAELPDSRLVFSAGFRTYKACNQHYGTFFLIVTDASGNIEMTKKYSLPFSHGYAWVLPMVLTVGSDEAMRCTRDGKELIDLHLGDLTVALQHQDSSESDGIHILKVDPSNFSIVQDYKMDVRGSVNSGSPRGDKCH